ncbi:MAG: hypothetical protein HYZ14_11305 [Bacteroidetes bacterium]|nr:hypothetical protein [Bacteroidota bacterium]
MTAEKTKELLASIEKNSALLFPEISQKDSFYAAFMDQERGVLAFSAVGCECIFFYDYRRKKRLFTGMIEGVIRAVSFHPEQDIAAVSTLGHGGYGEVFGQVYLLNYSTGEIQPVFSDALSPGVYSASFKPGNRLWMQLTDVAGQCYETEIDLTGLPVDSQMLRNYFSVSKTIIPEPSLEVTAGILERIIREVS